MNDAATKSNTLPSSRGKSTSASISKYQQKKQKALEAAADVFASKGFHGATTQDIAEELGIQQGSLYYYFKSKEQALQEVCEFGLQSYVDQMQKICAKDQSIETKLLAIATSHLSNYRNKHSAMKVHNDQRLYLPIQRRETIKKLGSQYRELLEELIRNGINSGSLRNDLDPHFVAYSIIGLCNAWGGNLMRDGQLDLFETIQQCVDIIFGGIKSQPNF